MYAVAKILGVIAILQPMFKTIKEWAYAGFAFNFISAFVSRAIVGDGVPDLIPPLIMLAVLFFTYFLWKKYEKVNSI
jgi:L-lactate permease